MKNDSSKSSNKELLDIIKKLRNKKKYGLVWEDEKNREIFEKKSTNSLPILDEIKNKEISTDKTKPVNVIIEGDNYHTLTTLNFTHQKKIDLIYIDPPYNTGNKDFRYNDRWVEKEDTYRHSKWISFMNKRLRLAKNLLSESGAIFISIDINELTQLKLLCDEIFGEKNLVSLITVKVKDPAGVGQQSFIFDVTEYGLLYAKKIEALKKTYPKLPEDIKEIKNKEELFKEHSSYKKIINSFGKAKFVREIYRKNVGKIKIYSCSNYKIGKILNLKFKDIIKKRNLIFADYNPSGGMVKAIINKIPKEGLSFYEYIPIKGKTAGKKTKVFFLNRRILAILDSVVSYQNQKLFKKSKMTNIWTVSNASLHLEGNVTFTNGKKPILLLEKIIKLFPKQNLKVLDFFAGSGTTGEAVLLLNKIDGANRSFILCNSNESDDDNNKFYNDQNGICRKITYQRIKNAIKGYKKRDPLTGNLRYYKCSFLPRSINRDEMKIKISDKCSELICLHEGIYTEIFFSNHYKIYKENNKVMAIYHSLDYANMNQLKNKLNKISCEKMLYCLTLDPLGLDLRDFDEWNNVVLKPIPQKILDIFESIYEY